MWPILSLLTFAFVTSTPQRVAHDAFISDSLVLSAVTFPVLRRSEDPLAEKSVLLRLEGSVVDSFRLRNFSVRTSSRIFSGRCQPDLQRLEIIQLIIVIVITFIGHFPFPMLLPTVLFQPFQSSSASS